MFGLFKKDPIQKLEIEYAHILEKAVEAQRNGNIELYSQLSFEAEKILNEIDRHNELKEASK